MSFGSVDFEAMGCYWHVFEAPCLAKCLWLRGLLFGFNGDHNICIHLDQDNQALSPASAKPLTAVCHAAKHFRISCPWAVGISSMLINYAWAERIGLPWFSTFLYWPVLGWKMGVASLSDGMSCQNEGYCAMAASAFNCIWGCLW